MAASRRAVAVVDGEHYPPVVRAAIADLGARGTTVIAALVAGGTEKVAASGAPVDLGVPSVWAPGTGLRAVADALVEMVRRERPDVVVDLSDEPVLDHRRRLQLAAHVLTTGVPYEGTDFRFAPPARSAASRRPTIAVLGTGKRTGKTAVTGELARRLVAAGRTPVIVAMGRGGPPEPVVIPARGRIDVAALLDVVAGGEHAASDFYEDALTTGVATVGARRCGGGLAGGVAVSNVAGAVAAADREPGDLLITEGSGAAIPPARADATVLVVPAGTETEMLDGYLGRYRVLLADLLVVTMAESSAASHVPGLLKTLRSISPQAHVLCTAFRPVPLGPVTGARVFFATTAPSSVTASLAGSLERRYGCEVVATSHRLADRPGLTEDLTAAEAFDVLLTECKAAAVDVAARMATQVGARVVFCDNRPVILEEPGSEAPDADVFADAAARLARLADERFTAEVPEAGGRV